MNYNILYVSCSCSLFISRSRVSIYACQSNTKGHEQVPNSTHITYYNHLRHNTNKYILLLIDYCSSNVLECCAALSAVCKIVTVDMIPAVIGAVIYIIGVLLLLL
jgi:hypothetical protein